MGHGTQCKLNRSNNEAQTTPDVTEINYNPLNNVTQLYIFSPLQAGGKWLLHSIFQCLHKDQIASNATWCVKTSINTHVSAVSRLIRTTLNIKGSNALQSRMRACMRACVCMFMCVKGGFRGVMHLWQFALF